MLHVFGGQELIEFNLLNQVLGLQRKQTRSLADFIRGLSI